MLTKRLAPRRILMALFVLVISIAMVLSTGSNASARQDLPDNSAQLPEAQLHELSTIAPWITDPKTIVYGLEVATDDGEIATADPITSYEVAGTRMADGGCRFNYRLPERSVDEKGQRHVFEVAYQPEKCKTVLATAVTPEVEPPLAISTATTTYYAYHTSMFEEPARWAPCLFGSWTPNCSIARGNVPPVNEVRSDVVWEPTQDCANGVGSGHSVYELDLTNWQRDYQNFTEDFTCSSAEVSADIYWSNTYFCDGITPGYTPSKTRTHIVNGINGLPNDWRDGIYAPWGSWSKTGGCSALLQFHSIDDGY